MKKLLFTLFAALPFLYGCSSVPANLNEYSPVAIITIYSNPSVPWYDEKTGKESVEDGIISGAVNRLINKKNPEQETVQQRIDEASELFSQKLRAAGLSVIDPTSNSDLSIYKDAGKNFADYLGNTVPAAGYDAITSSNGKKNRMTCRESGAGSVLYVNFRFQKMYAKEGVHNKGISARLIMSVFGTDSNGNKIINKEYKAVSEDYAPLIKTDRWDKNEVLSFFPELENQLINRFLSDFVLGGELPDETAFKPSTIKIKKPAEKERADTATPEASAEDAVLAEKRATAKKLLERGMTAEEVSEVTGLSAEEIKKL
ncbi:MAG: hypothetical protein IJ630_11580 [Treponema sp.]|nr:hypothetical protein [Treponema sp.]